MEPGPWLLLFEPGGSELFCYPHIESVGKSSVSRVLNVSVCNRPLHDGVEQIEFKLGCAVASKQAI